MTKRRLDVALKCNPQQKIKRNENKENHTKRKILKCNEPAYIEVVLACVCCCLMKCLREEEKEHRKEKEMKIKGKEKNRGTRSEE